MGDISGRYDVIVVGAGLGGQVAANYAAANGKRVLLTEQNHQTGGNMSGFTRKGFSFDGGDQSFESLGIVLPILREVAGLSPDDFVKSRYRMVSPDFDFFIENPAQVAEALQAGFPDEPGIAPLFAEIGEVDRFLSANYDPWSFPLLNAPSVGAVLKVLPWLPKLKRWSTFRYREKALRVIRHPGLRNWLTNVGYYRMPYLFFAGFWHLWSSDYWYPRGGMQALNDRLATAFRDKGGDVLLNSLVTGITMDRSGRRATGVTLESGDQVGADVVVWAADYKNLVEAIIGRDQYARRTANKLLNARLTESLVSVYLGLDLPETDVSATLGGAQHPFYFPNYDVTFPSRASPEDVHQSMWVALNHYGAHGPAAPAGKTTLTLQTLSSHGWQNCWNNGTDSLPRTGEYRQLKQRIGMELVELAENLVPGLRDHIEFMDVGTPLSSYRFSRNTHGSSGGWCYDDQVSPVWRLPALNRIRTPLRNVLCAGHYAVWPGGVISAALSGRMVGNMVSGRRALTPLAE